ncbi:MAG: hypothetical protein IJW92_05805 [Clostridia bacterium]|nr:hypothetical protein [Clostridia bacterium]
MKHLITHIGTNLLILLFAVLEIALSVLLIISLVTSDDTLGFEVKEQITVSSALIQKGSQDYSCQLTGIVSNVGEIPLTVDALLVTVSDGKQETELVLPGFTMPARTKYELYKEWQDGYNYDRVTSVVMVCGDDEYAVANSTAGMGFNSEALIYVLLMLVDAAALLYFIKQRYYLAQQDTMKNI